MEKQTSPRAGDWGTVAWAAEQIGVSMRQIYRLIADGKLTEHRPRMAKRERPERRILLSATEVQAYAAARCVTKGKGQP